MTRVRLAAALGVVAALAVLTTAALAVTTYVADDPTADVEEPIPAPTRTVTDAGTGATFDVPAADWKVRGARSRIYYADDQGRPVAVVRGAAVYRSGYCDERPRGSSRAFAGFTREPFEAWVGALGAADSESTVSTESVTLADGSEAQLRWARIRPAVSGPCAAPEVYVAMVRAGEVRAVLVADAGAPGTLAGEDAEPILTSLRTVD